MSIKTLRKRIAITATTAILAGALSVISAPASNATHESAGSTNNTNLAVAANGFARVGLAGATTGSLMTATKANTAVGATAAVTSATLCATNTEDSAVSKGLLYKDSTSGIAQSASVLPGGILSLYSCAATAVAFVASAGSFSGGFSQSAAWTFNGANTKAWGADVTSDVTADLGLGDGGLEGTAVAILWTAPTTAGTYTVSLYGGYYTNSSGNSVAASADNGATPGFLAGNITVTVGASTGGSYSAANSACQAVRGSNTYNSASSSNIDDSGTNANGVDWSIDLFLRDGYGADLDSGALVATATNGALVAWGTAGATPVAGSASTAVTSGAGNNSTIRVSQGTANAPMTSTVTISYNGTVVCSKTVSIAGTVAALTIPAANIAVQDLSASAGNAKWFTGDTRDGTFYVVATDSVGNRVATPATLGSYSADGATLGTTVTTVTFDSASLATKTSSTDVLSATVGRHTCAATAGTQKGVVIKFTLANGTVIKSAPIDLSCADDPASMTASFDKAKYISGEVATLTISFKDSKGNVANNVVAPGTAGTAVVSVPGMTLVSTTGASDAVLKSGGKFTYTYTVGQTAGTFAAVVDFTTTNTTTGQYSTVQTPSYSISTGGDTTTNADVLKSIVALIASINKQIQALQKLILKR